MNKIKIFISNKLGNFVFALCLSWLFAICSQIIIPLPFGFVPISLQPVPVLFTSLVFGWVATRAYLLFLIQGALGLPFFAFGLGGLARLLGPTGGYLIGFLFASIFICVMRDLAKKANPLFVFSILFVAYCLIFLTGLLQLSLFINSSNLLQMGLYPFILGDLIKALLMTLWFTNVGHRF